MKVPRTKRDRYKDGDIPKISQPAGSTKLKFDLSPSHAPSQVDGQYPTEAWALRGHPFFEEDSVAPLAANVESWSNLTSTAEATDGLPRSAAAKQHLHGLSEHELNLGSNRHPTAEEYEDDVFADDTFAAYPLNVPPAFNLGVDFYDHSYWGAASLMDIVFCLGGMGSFLADVGTDLYLAYLYWSARHYWWFALTLAFVAVPAVTMTVFSLVLYFRDWKVVGEKISRPRWASRVFFLVLQMAPLIRLLETMIFACRSRSEKDVKKRRVYYEKMVDENTDSMMLRLFESFLEAAPQLVLQLYVISQIGTGEGAFLVVVQCAGLVTSMITVATSLVSYQVSLRLSQPLKAKISLGGMALQFLWRLFTISARVLALAMFASHFKHWVFIVVGIHWLIMMGWVIKQETNYCRLTDAKGDESHSRILEFFFRVLTAFVHIFCVFNLLEGHSRLRYIVFYALLFIENATMILAWYIMASTLTADTWYHMPAMLVVLLGFWIGIMFQVLYYKCLHPNNLSVLYTHNRIRWWVPCKYLSLTQENHFVDKDKMVYHSSPSLNQGALMKADPHTTSIPQTSAVSLNHSIQGNNRTPIYRGVVNAPSFASSGSALPHQVVPPQQWQPPECQVVSSAKKRRNHNDTQDSIKAGGGNLTGEAVPAMCSVPQAARTGQQPPISRPPVVDSSFYIEQPQSILEVKSTAV